VEGRLGGGRVVRGGWESGRCEESGKVVRRGYESGRVVRGE